MGGRFWHKRFTATTRGRFATLWKAFVVRDKEALVRGWCASQVAEQAAELTLKHGSGLPAASGGASDRPPKRPARAGRKAPAESAMDFPVGYVKKHGGAYYIVPPAGPSRLSELNVVTLRPGPLGPASGLLSTTARLRRRWRPVTYSVIDGAGPTVYAGRPSTWDYRLDYSQWDVKFPSLTSLLDHVRGATRPTAPAWRFASAAASSSWRGGPRSNVPQNGGCAA